VIPSFVKLLLSQMEPEERAAILREFGLQEYARFTETQRWRGDIRVTIRNLAGEVVSVEEHRNLIVAAGHNLVRDALRGTVTDLKIKYMAIGTGNSAPSAGQVKLDAEVYRQQPTNFTPVSTGVLTTTTVVGPSVAIATWNEVAWFAGASASAAQDTGVMVARVLYNHAHTNQESVQFDRQDTQA
jgi:hypothetical protein